MINQDQIKTLRNRIDAIGDYLKINEKRMQLSEEELKTQDPDFWNDPKAAEAKMKSIRGIKFWINAYEVLRDALGDLEVLMEFIKEGEGSEDEIDQVYLKLSSEVEELELKNMLSGEEDSLSAVLQITAGAGGTESCDWALMLNAHVHYVGTKKWI
jgi:peptide chain release factor 2